MTGVMCHVSGVKCHLPRIWCHLSDVWCHVSPVNCQKRHRQSHLLPPSQVSCFTCQESSVKCQLSNARCQRSGVRCQTSGVMYHLSHVRKSNGKSRHHPLTPPQKVLVCHGFVLMKAVSTQFNLIPSLTGWQRPFEFIWEIFEM